jgi:hypothetical protein
MASKPTATPVLGNSAFRTIITAGLIAGILDGSDAAIFIGLIQRAGVSRVFQFIASGLLGPRSFAEGWRSGALGVLIHFFIATSAAGAYYGFSRRIPLLTKRPFVSGATFGICLFIFMHYFVVRLSAAHSGSLGPVALANQLFAHIFLVGIPIALVVRRNAGTRFGFADR